MKIKPMLAINMKKPALVQQCRFKHLSDYLA
jgi:hypothetical protein